MERKDRDVAALAAAAIGVFAERGYGNASMRDIARAAGMAKGSIYYYVASKEALLAAGLQIAFDAFFSILDDPAAAAGPGERLAGALERLVEAVLQHAPAVRVLTRLGRESRAEGVALERRRELERRLGTLVQELGSDGNRRPPADPAVAGRLLLGLVFSVTEWYRPGGRLPPADVARTVRSLALEGLGPAGSRPEAAPARV